MNGPLVEKAMNQILADVEMTRQLEGVEEPVTVVNDKGSIIGVFTPIKFPHSPYSREEVERSRQQCRDSGGRSLAEILAELQEQHS